MQAQIIGSFPDGWDPLDNDDSGVYVIVDNDKIACAWDTNRGTPTMYINCAETDNKRYDLGEIIYKLEVVSLTDSEYVLRDEQGNEYTFIRQD